ncbi:hypothetical protein [Aeromicrobium terrae]|nr:hypothetical protein [Aeromicrobium terrae]
MTNRIPMAAAAFLTVTALYVGGWAGLFPRSFYDDFPGLNRYWVSVDGPYNEHLVRDVGGLYLALALAGILALLWRDRRSMVMLGAAWAIFSALHLGYHLDHLDPLSTADKIGEVAALSISFVLALVLIATPRRLHA